MPAVAVARPKPDWLRIPRSHADEFGACKRPQGPATAAGALGYKGATLLPLAQRPNAQEIRFLLLYYLSGKSSRGYYGGNWYSGGKVLLPGLLFRSSFCCEFWSEFLAATEVG